jgi:hypothetical protein
MARLTIPFVGPTYQSRSPNANDQKCVNWYPKLEGQGAKSGVGLYPTPGLQLAVASPNGANCRGNGIVFRGYAYWVFGNKLYQMTPGESMTEIGTLATSTGRVSMDCSDTELVIVDGTQGYAYTWDGSAYTWTSDIQGTDPDFPDNPTHVAVLGFYFIVNKADTGVMYVSALNDALNWDLLDYATAESRPDFIKALWRTNRELILFGEETTEFYYNSGNADFAFSRIPGGVNEWGIQAPHSLADVDGSIFFLGRGLNGGASVVQLKGQAARIVSTRDIEWQISQMTANDDAFGFCYTQAGEQFYVLTFPAGDKTFVYSLSSGVWHERKSYGLGRHRAAGHVYFNGSHYIGDYANGNVYTWELDKYTDNGDPIERIRRAPVIHRSGKNWFHHSLIVDIQTGVGVTSGQGSDPQLMLRFSDDSHTWSNEMWTDIGAIGEYSTQVRFDGLGMSKARTYEITITDPVEAIVLGAYLDASEAADGW